MKKVLVVGGGLVGSLVAVTMKKRGYDVTLYEKRTDPRLETSAAGRSINLIVTSRGFHALKNVGLMDDVLKMTVSVTGRMIHSKTRETAYQAYGRDKSECNYSISRNDLNNCLLSACERFGVPIHFGYELLENDLDSKIVTFTNGESDRYDILLGTDGAGSLVRKNFKNYMSTFTESVEYLSAGYKELFMPKDSGLDTSALHIWPRGPYMLMALPNLDGSFTMTLYLAHKGAEKSFEALTDESAVRKFLTEEFPDATDLMPKAVDEFLENPEGKLGTVRAAPWIYKDSVALLGDAAHAIVPFFGQGMNSGFEDVSYLVKFLDETNDNWELALKKYDEYQRPNANAIADMALENFVEMSEKVGDASFLAKKKLEASLEKEFPNLYRARYGMITYTLIPYAKAQKVGVIQEEILNELQKHSHNGEFDKVFAEKLINEKLTPFMDQHQLNISRYQL